MSESSSSFISVPEYRQCVDFLLECLLAEPEPITAEEVFDQEIKIRNELKSRGMLDALPEDKQSVVSQLSFWHARNMADEIYDIRVGL
ncbi:hypothetical protein H0V99_03395 [Candidatus Saccharibacteria bacterium]|nr:hypothetical protein [Candidatus Saccharibacteria bacterium]